MVIQAGRPTAPSSTSARAQQPSAAPRVNAIKRFFSNPCVLLPQQATRSRASALEVRDVRFGLWPRLVRGFFLMTRRRAALQLWGGSDRETRKDPAPAPLHALASG